MTQDERLKALLGRGYFLKELPPPFTSTSLANKVAEIRARFEAYEGSLTARQRDKFPPTSRFTRFDMARKGHSRRMLGVPNPVNQYYLSELISRHQESFEERSAGSSIGLTKVNIVEGDGRAVQMPKLSELGERRIIAYSTAGTILQTDLLSFYHSIYTHSIPWALHGKRETKRFRSPDHPEYFGNKIDFLVRSCQDGQTVGIPVGPDTSRIISELILLAVEKDIPSSAFGSITGGYRYIDDFFLCFRSNVDAETFLAALRDAVLKYDLQLNASKTHIMNALDFNEESWPSDIAMMSISSSGRPQRRDLMRYFTEAIKMAKLFPDESIASFAIRKTAKIVILKENWDVYEPFILRVARENSNCLDSVVKILCTYAAIGYPISDKVRMFAESMVEAHAPYNHHYEVIWTLWLCRSLNIRLSERATSLVCRIENALCACMVLMLRARRLLTGRGAISSWATELTADDLFSENWILIYEASRRKSWNLPGAEEAVNGNALFAALAAENVSFFENTATNVALDLPGIEALLRQRIAERRHGILPGAIFVDFRTGNIPRRYEKLGEDYGTEEPDWLSGLGFYEADDNDLDDETPF